MLAVPVGPRSAADTVRSLLSGHLLQRSRKLRHAAHWGHARATGYVQ
jgi:hypothetical protein